MSMYGIGVVLLISLLTGRYGPAGTVAAAGSVGLALSGPVIAKLADQHGQRRVLLPQLAVFAASMTALVACAQVRAPFWTLLITGVVSGASMPSLGTMVRTRWSALVGTDPRRLHTAFALESVADELVFVIGPALAALLATQFLPASGVAAAGLFCIAGTIAFTAQRATEPAAVPSPRRATAPEPPAGPDPAAGPALVRAGGWRRALGRRMPSLPAPGLVTLAPVFLLLGATFSMIDLSTVAFATERGARPLAGVVLGTYALGSAVGGLWYGSKHWRAGLGRRFTIALACAVCGFTTYWAMPGLAPLAVAGFLASLAVAPALASGFAILERQAPPHRKTEAMAWLGSTISVGVAFGSAAVGRIIDAHGARWGLAAAGAAGLAALLTCLAGARRLATDRPAG